MSSIRCEYLKREKLSESYDRKGPHLPWLDSPFQLKQFRAGLQAKKRNAEDREEDPKLCRGEIQLRTRRLKRVLAVFSIGVIPMIAIRNFPMR
jgi:hypothetical protein